MDLVLSAKDSLAAFGGMEKHDTPRMRAVNVLLKFAEFLQLLKASSFSLAVPASSIEINCLVL